MRYFLLLLSLIFIQDLFAQVSLAYRDSVFTEYFRRTSGWTASDATISVPLPCQDKTLWLFGDTHIDGYNAADTSIACLFQVRNSMMVQDMQDPSSFTTILDQTGSGIDRTPVKLNDNNTTYFWPGHGYATEDTAYVFWQQYQGNDYEHIGNYVSKIYTPNMTNASSIKELTKLPIPNGFEFGVSVVVDSADNYIYLYGHKKDWIILRPLLARCSMDQNISGPWEFFNGTGWSSDANNAAQIMASTNDYVSASYSVLKLQGKYYLISQDIGFLVCGLGREIYSWESDSPEGPFTNKKLLYTIEDKYEGEYLVTYNATAHPEFIRDNELLISYNVNGFDNDVTTPCENECQDAFADRRNADGYRPKFIRVPLDYIDPALNVPNATLFCKNEPLPTGLYPQREKFEKVNIYPNPSETGSFFIDVEDYAGNGSIKVAVKDLRGQLLYQSFLKNGKKTVRLENSGVYFVHVYSLKRQNISKIVVQ